MPGCARSYAIQQNKVLDFLDIFKVMNMLCVVKPDDIFNIQNMNYGVISVDGKS